MYSIDNLLEYILMNFNLPNLGCIRYYETALWPILQSCYNLKSQFNILNISSASNSMCKQYGNNAITLEPQDQHMGVNCGKHELSHLETTLSRVGLRKMSAGLVRCQLPTPMLPKRFSSRTHFWQWQSFMTHIILLDKKERNATCIYY